MAARARTRALDVDVRAWDGLLPAARGHAARGTAAPSVPADAIEPFAPRVGACLAASRATGREHGFLAYAPAEADRAFVAEDDSSGTRHRIAWHWHARDATVAFSFHTHPGRTALSVPSGVDLVGALVRGDHLIYVLATDGRLSGWRFRDPRGYPRVVEDAMRVLEKSRSLRRDYVDFLYDALDALRPRLVEPVYAARVAVDDAGSTRISRAEPDGRFFLPGELAPRA